jgi:hypothetical protein
MENCKYINRCYYERKDSDFVCQSDSMSSTCNLYSAFEELDSKPTQSMIDILGDIVLTKPSQQEVEESVNRSLYLTWTGKSRD